MFQTIKNWLYKMVVSSGVLLHFLLVVLPLTIVYVRLKKTSYHKIKDEAGETLRVIKYNGKLYPPLWLDRILSVKEITIRHDDVMLCGYPKSGCHWMHEILTLLVTKKAEMTRYGKILHGQIDFLPQIILDSFPSPRVLNSHYLYEDLPEQIKARKTKIIWTVRSPKDTVVSYYHQFKSISVYGYDGTFENFFKLFISGQVEYGSYFDYLLDWQKTIGTQKDNPILMVPYENLKEDPVGTVEEIARFLKIDISDGLAGKIVEATRFDKMKTKYAQSALFRKGQVGDWKNWLTEEQNQQLQQLWKDKMSDCVYQPEM